jgi:spore germination protein GerM
MNKAFLFFVIISLVLGILIGLSFFQRNNQAIPGILGKPTIARTPVTSVQERIDIKVYFGKKGEGECEVVFPVTRSIIKTQAAARAALSELFSGPTEKEKVNGYFTSINPGVKIQKLTIENGIARADFDITLEKAVGGSCRVAAIRAQIRETLLQFPTVKSVIISIDGRTEDILQP